MVYEVGKRIEPIGSRQQLVQKDEVQQIFDRISAYLKNLNRFMGRPTYRGYSFRIGEPINENLSSPIIVNNIESSRRVGPGVPIEWVEKVWFDAQGDPHIRYRKRIARNTLDLPSVLCPVCRRSFFHRHGRQRICDECLPKRKRDQARVRQRRHRARMSRSKLTFNI